MFTWIRSHQRNLMLIVTILTILAFVVLFNMGSLETIGRSDYTKVFGRTVTVTQMQREARLSQLAQALGLGEYVSALNAGGNGDDASEFVLNALVIRHEARELGVAPMPSEIKDAIAALPVFQTSGQFDPQKYLAFSERYLAPLGFTEAQIEEVVTDSLRFERLKQIIESPLAVSDLEINQVMRAFAKTKGQAVTFNQMDFIDTAEIPEERITALFEKRSPQLNTRATRAVRYVTFSLPANAAALTGTERTKALQNVADASAGFLDKAATVGFEKAAAEAGLSPKTTLDFTVQGQVITPTGIDNSALASGDPIQALARPTFLLTEKSPLTGAIQSGDTFYVAELIRETPSRPMTIDEARADLVQSIRLESAQAKLEEAAVRGLATLREAQSAGRPFAEAANASGLKLVPFEVAVADEAAPMEQREFANSTLMLEPGELSEFVPRGGGGFAVFLDSREPPSDELLADRKEQAISFLEMQKAGILFYEWLVSARVRAGVGPGANI